MARAATRAVTASFPLGLLRHGVTRVTAFGSNPGELGMLVYAPPGLRAGRPLVVVLHGCGQDAANFAADAGWIALARNFGLALLIPEQAQGNNRNRCFNWFRPEDVRRGGGEAMSIRQMVRVAAARFGSDKRRIFIVGFSAGGGMAAAMLAAYPAVFAAGAVVAGMPVGSARTMMGAVMHMRRADQHHPAFGVAQHGEQFLDDQRENLAEHAPSPTVCARWRGRDQGRPPPSPRVPRRWAG